MATPDYTKSEADVHGCTNVAVGTTPGATETRETIDKKLELAGWLIQDKNRINQFEKFVAIQCNLEFVPQICRRSQDSSFGAMNNG